MNVRNNDGKYVGTFVRPDAPGDTAWIDLDPRVRAGANNFTGDTVIDRHAVQPGDTHLLLRRHVARNPLCAGQVHRHGPRPLHHRQPDEHSRRRLWRPCMDRRQGRCRCRLRCDCEPGQ